MSELEKLARHWVEIAEESTPERIVLKPMSEKIPPARGRRWLDLSSPGQAAAFTANRADKMTAKQGDWKFQDGLLELKAPGWNGEYEIEEINEEILVIVPKQEPE